MVYAMSQDARLPTVVRTGEPCLLRLPLLADSICKKNSRKGQRCTHTPPRKLRLNAVSQ